MRTLLLLAALLACESAHAQGMWQMNAAFQNQFNQAYAAAYRPYYYAPAYYPRYAPAYSSYTPNYGYTSPSGYNFWAQEAANQEAFQLRQMNFTLQNIEFNQRRAR